MEKPTINTHHEKYILNKIKFWRNRLNNIDELDYDSKLDWIKELTTAEVNLRAYEDVKEYFCIIDTDNVDYYDASGYNLLKSVRNGEVVFDNE